VVSWENYVYKHTNLIIKGTLRLTYQGGTLTHTHTHTHRVWPYLIVAALLLYLVRRFTPGSRQLKIQKLKNLTLRQRIKVLEVGLELVSSHVTTLLSAGSARKASWRGYFWTSRNLGSAGARFGRPNMANEPKRVVSTVNCSPYPRCLKQDLHSTDARDHE
jgi:hypothetical protein